MQVFIFSSTNLTNIWAGIGARQWAVSHKQAENPSIKTKAKNLPLGAFGLLYCSATGAFTTPFITRSRPDVTAIVKDVWPEPWRLPFGIIPLGTPKRMLPTDDLQSRLPGLRATGKVWSHVFHIQGLTAFVPSEVEDSDWEIIIEVLADR